MSVIDYIVLGYLVSTMAGGMACMYWIIFTDAKDSYCDALFFTLFPGINVLSAIIALDDAVARTRGRVMRSGNGSVISNHSLRRPHV